MKSLHLYAARSSHSGAARKGLIAGSPTAPSPGLASSSPWTGTLRRTTAARTARRSHRVTQLPLLGPAQQRGGVGGAPRRCQG